MYMAYTQSCAEHMRHRLGRTRHLEMGAGWDTEERGEASTSTGGRGSTSFWRRGWGLEIWGRGERDQTTCKSKSEVQPPLQKYESLYLSN